MVITLGQQYNVGEKPTVILYTYINRHAGTAERRWMENPVLPSSCVTPAGASIEVQNEWEENTQTHTHRDTNKSSDKPIHHQTIKTNPIQSLKRAQQRTMMMRIFIIQVHDPVIIHLKVRGKRKELGSSLHFLSGLRYTDAPHAWT